MREETPISVKKIWVNVKNFWWVCALALLVTMGLVAVSAWKEYQRDRIAAQRDTYQANSMIFFPVDSEMEATTLMTVLTSQQIVSQIDAQLAAQGWETTDGNRDKISAIWQGNCFPITVISEGEARTRLISETATEALLAWLQEHLGGRGQIVNQTEVYTCIERASGQVETYPLGTPRDAGLTLKSFLGWKKLMIVCAGVLCGAAVIFVLMIFDTKLRTKKEAASVCPYPFLGTVGKNAGEEGKAVYTMACRHRTLGGTNLLYAAYSHSDLFVQAAQIAEGTGDCAVQAVIWEKERLEQLKDQTEYGGAVLFICLNRDTVDQIEMVAQDIKNLQIPMIGYVVVEG